MGYNDWSTTPGNNNSNPPDGAPEGMAPGLINDTLREIMAQVALLVAAIKDSTVFPDGSIEGVKLADLAVNTAQLADKAVDLSKLADGTAGSLIAYAETTGEAAEISAGALNTVLMGNGAGVPPSMKNLHGIAKEWSKAQTFAATTLADAAAIDWNLEDNQVAEVTLTDNRTLNAPTNMKDGGTYILLVKQDATGSRALAFASAYKFPGGSVPTLTADANALDIFTFVSDGTLMHGAFLGDSK